MSTIALEERGSWCLVQVTRKWPVGNQMVTWPMTLEISKTAGDTI